MNFFRTRPRSPTDIVRTLRDSLAKLESNSSDSRRKAIEDASKNLAQMKHILCGDGETEPVPEQVAQLSQEVYATDLLYSLVVHLAKLEFEARKDVTTIFGHLIRRQIGMRYPTVEYLSTKNEVIFVALKGYENPEIALRTGTILRDMIRHEPLAKILLYSNRFYDFIDYIQQTSFDISFDAQTSFKETITKHKPMVAEYLEVNYDQFFNSYSILLQSSSYVTKRQSLKLLGEILLDRANYTIMNRYITSEDNLKMIMNHLKDKSKNIQFEAFHVFKIFVANPRKPPQIVAILKRNDARLLKFLRNFQNDKDDETFNDEKQFLIRQISAL